MRRQLPLIDRGRFCPGRDCGAPCGAPGSGISCTCKPCYCPACRARTARARRGPRLRGDVLPEVAQRQARLFYAEGAAT